MADQLTRILKLRRSFRCGDDWSAAQVQGITAYPMGHASPPGGVRIKHKTRRRKGGAYPLSHLYGYFGLVSLCRLGHDVPWVKA